MLHLRHVFSLGIRVRDNNLGRLCVVGSLLCAIEGGMAGYVLVTSMSPNHTDESRLVDRNHL